MHRSIIDQFQPAEVIVVDASDDRALKALVRDSIAGNTSIRYLHWPKGHVSKNVGVQESFKEVVLILGDGIILTKDYVQEILNVFVDPDGKSRTCTSIRHAKRLAVPLPNRNVSPGSSAATVERNRFMVRKIIPNF